MDVACLAEAAVPVRLSVPPWGGVMLAVVGAAYLLLGSRAARIFDVLSMTLLGCAVGLALSAHVPLNQSLLVILSGIALGGLTAFFRTVAHGILSALVMGITLATFAALAIGPEGFAPYLEKDVESGGFAILFTGPNLTADPVLAAGLAGLLGGAAVASLKWRMSERLITSAQGAGLVVWGLVQVVRLWRGAGAESLVASYPLTLGASWVCLTAIGMAAQKALVPPPPPREPKADDVAPRRAPRKRRRKAPAEERAP